MAVFTTYAYFAEEWICWALHAAILEVELQLQIFLLVPPTDMDKNFFRFRNRGLDGMQMEIYIAQLA